MSRLKRPRRKEVESWTRMQSFLSQRSEARAHQHLPSKALGPSSLVVAIEATLRARTRPQVWLTRCRGHSIDAHLLNSPEVVLRQVVNLRETQVRGRLAVDLHSGSLNNLWCLLSLSLVIRLDSSLRGRSMCRVTTR